MMTNRWWEDPLGYLLGAERASRFFSDDYERNAVIAEAPDGGRFGGLITIDALDQIITGTDLTDGDLMLADASAEDGVANEDYVDSNGYIDRGSVAALYRRGATIILNQAQRSIPALGQLCQGLEYIFSCHVQTNLYLTPADAQGFSTHFDNHDVFIIQAEGEKLWRLYDRPIDTPFRGERFQSTVHAKGELRHEFVMKAGDCAYVPRGMMHDAETVGDAPSLHITVGLITRTWADLMLEAVSEVAVRSPAFRTSLPAGYALHDFDRSAARAKLTELGEILARELKLDPAMDLLADSFIRTRGAQNRSMIVEARRAILPDDQFRLAPMVPRRMAQDGDSIALLLPGTEQFFTLESGPALNRALDGSIFTLADLGFEHAEPLTRRLLSYGVVVRV